MLAGKRPWDANSVVALIGKIMTEEAPPLSELRPDAPEELLAIVDRALAKEREQRYQSCHEFQNDLEQLLVGLGQTITPTRVADFIRAYTPEAAPASEAEVTDGSLGAVEEESFAGTGAAPQLIPHERQQQPEREAGTRMLETPVLQPPKSRGLLYGIAAFAFIAMIGGGAAIFFLKGQGDDQSAPVAVERATIVEQPKAPPPAPPPPPPTRVVEEPVKARPPPKKLAVAEPPPPPVVVIKEAPRPPPPPPPAAPVVVAKGELVLLIRPWAKVEVDGHEIGVTPLADPVQLSAGDHQVRLINPDLGKDITRTVHIVASERNTLKEILDE